MLSGGNETFFRDGRTAHYVTKRLPCRFGISQEELGEEKLNDVESGNGREQALFCLSQYSYQAKARVTFRFTETKEVSAPATKKRRKTNKRVRTRNFTEMATSQLEIDNENECAAEVENAQATQKVKKEGD